MKRLFITKLIAWAFIAAMFSCSSAKKVDEIAISPTKQEYILVDARVKLYHDDGTRSYKDYQPFKTRSVAILQDYTPSEKITKLSKYGGWMAHQEEATGFFYVKKIDGRWWGIDPLGYRYINIALNSVSMSKSERNTKARKAKFGSDENWARETIDLLQENGFNCAGSWSDDEAIIQANRTAEKPFSYTINWNFMSSYGRKRGGTFQQPGHIGYPNNAIFVFDPEFETFCDEHAQQLVKYKDDPNVFGHFSDNEMPFKFHALDNYLALSEGDPGNKAAQGFMQKQGISEDQITDLHRETFMALVAEKYFSIVSAAIKRYDPNHMYIGARFYSSEKNHKQFMKTAGQYLDVVSNNYYNHWTRDSIDMAKWTNWTGKPFIVTEYYTKGEDSGMGNTSGAGWLVRTQKDRGLFYQNYILAFLESKNCVGWHYFKYQDNDPEAKGVDPSNVDANKGVVNNEYDVWMPMMDKMRELNIQVYDVITYFDRY